MAKKINVLASPLATPEMLEILNQVIRACAVNAADCERCEKCQLNVDNAKMENEETQRVAYAIKAEFFPDAP